MQNNYEDRIWDDAGESNNEYGYIGNPNEYYVNNFTADVTIMDACFWEYASQKPTFFEGLKKSLMDSGRKITILTETYQEIHNRSVCDENKAFYKRYAERLIEEFADAKVVTMGQRIFDAHSAEKSSTFLQFVLECIEKNIPCAALVGDLKSRVILKYRVRQKVAKEPCNVKIITPDQI